MIWIGRNGFSGFTGVLGYGHEKEARVAMGIGTGLHGCITMDG